MRIVIDWDEYIELCYKLCNVIRDDFGNKLEYVYGIPRGGLIPATIVSHQLNAKLLLIEDELVDMVNYSRNVAVVDDIYDSGKTLDKLSFRIAAGCGEYPTSTSKPYVLFTRKTNLNSTYIYYRYVKSVSNDWIEFPYETGALKDTISMVKPPE